MKGPKHVSLYDDDWWLEHLEGEHAPSLEEDLELLLHNSAKDRSVFKSLAETRRLLKASEENSLPESGAYYDQLQSRIMASLELAIASEELEEKPVVRVSPRRPTVAPGVPRLRLAFLASRPVVNGFMVAVFLFSGVVFWLAHMNQGTAKNLVRIDQPVIAQDLASTAADEPQLIASSVIDFEDESDVVNEAVSKRIGRLSSRQMDEMFHSLKR